MIYGFHVNGGDACRQLYCTMTHVDPEEDQHLWDNLQERINQIQSKGVRTMKGDVKDEVEPQ